MRKALGIALLAAFGIIIISGMAWAIGWQATLGVWAVTALLTALVWGGVCLLLTDN